MRYQLLNQEADLSLLQRLLKIRNISDDPSDFLDPNLKKYRWDPFLINDMEKGVERIIQALKRREKIMIFWDYDVDGITSSYSLYKFITHFLGYQNISIMYPHRIEDGYGLKCKHLDIMKEKRVDLVITVDNGITSIQEAKYAKEIWIDLIITDHHHALDELPDALALINPQVSPNYPFKGLAGVGVAFKVICAMLQKSGFETEKRNQIFNFFLPIVAIGTVADIVPLVQENRVIVKKGLEIINNTPELLPRGLAGFLEYLNLKGNVDTFHIGFVIGPRINAGGRIDSPYNSLKILLCENGDQLECLTRIDEINTERRKLQELAFKSAEKSIDDEKKFLSATSEDFHEGIVGIVSGRLTEKYNKPSGIFKIDKERNQAVASLRAPAYFNIIEMLSTAADHLLRFGGHRGAGGLTVALDKLETVIKIFEDYCQEKIQEKDLEKVKTVDTYLLPSERDPHELIKIDQLAPFGEGNQEPLLLIENIQVHRVERVGKNGGSHMKIYGYFGEHLVTTMFWGKGKEADLIPSQISLLGRIKKDTFNGGVYILGVEILGE